MKITLWIAQIVLAGMFFMSGLMKLTTPAAELAAQMAWVADVPSWMPGVAGFFEVLAAFGLILPAATRILPSLTPLAASGLVVIMASASALHASRGEWEMVAVNTVLGLFAAFVAWGRARKVRVEPREFGATTASPGLV